MYRGSSISKHCGSKDFNSDVENYDCFLLAILLTICEDFHISLQGFTAFHFTISHKHSRPKYVWFEQTYQRKQQWYGVMCSQHAEVYPYFIYFVNFFIKGAVSKLPEFKRWMTVNLLTFTPSEDKSFPYTPVLNPFVSRAVFVAALPVLGQQCCCLGNWKVWQNLSLLKVQMLSFFFSNPLKKMVLRSTLRTAKNTVRELNMCRHRI